MVAGWCESFELNMRSIFGCLLSILRGEWMSSRQYVFFLSLLCITFTCRGHHKLSHARNISGTPRVMFILQLGWQSALSPVYGPRFLLPLLSSLSESFWQTRGPSDHSSVFYPCHLHWAFPPHLSMKTVPCVQFVESFFLLSLHRDGAEIWGRVGNWGPDFLLWSHPRRCLSL